MTSSANRTPVVVRSGLRTWLPLMQVLLAAALIARNLLRPLSYSSFTYPEREFCDALNAPVALVRYYWVRFALQEFPQLYAGWAGVIIENIMYIGLVGLLWYLVSIEMGVQEEGKVSIIAEKTGMRTAFDLLLMSFGIYLGIVSIRELYRFVMWHGVFVVPYFSWAAVIVVFYTRDSWVYKRQKKKAANSFD